jgi:hypothetical protein
MAVVDRFFSLIVGADGSLLKVGKFGALVLVLIPSIGIGGSSKIALALTGIYARCNPQNSPLKMSIVAPNCKAFCLPVSSCPSTGNCKFTIAEQRYGVAPQPCCDDFEPLNDPIDGDFVPVKNGPILILKGSGFVKFQTEKQQRKEFGVIPSSIFTLSIPRNAVVNGGQWAIVDRGDLQDYGQIVSIDRRSTQFMTLTIDTGKQMPFKPSEVAP